MDRHFSHGFNNNDDHFFRKLMGMINHMTPEDLNRFNKFLTDELRDALNNGGTEEPREFNYDGQTIKITFDSSGLEDVGLDELFDHEPENNDMSLDEMEGLLEYYVENELYEEAATLRDEINSRKNEK